MLKDKIYESESFDEYLDFPEYIVLKGITERLIELQGTSKELENQVGYIERKVYNYSQLYAF